MRREQNRWRTRKARKQDACRKRGRIPMQQSATIRDVPHIDSRIGIYALAAMLVRNTFGLGRGRRS